MPCSMTSVSRWSMAAIATTLLGAACTTPPRGLPAVASGAGSPLRVHGALPRSGAFVAADLEALGAEVVPWTFRDVRHEYRALRLDLLFTHLGFDRGAGGASIAPADRRTGWRLLVVARGADGFYAVFTMAELMPEMGPSRVFVAWGKDAGPLADDEGPLRLVVPTDQRGSRSVRRLTSLEVVDTRRFVDADIAGERSAR